MTDVVFLHAGVADERSSPGGAHCYRRSGVLDPVVELKQYLDVLGTDGVVLVGHSVGARIALDAALEHPDRVLGLFLIAPSVSGAPQTDALDPAVRSLVESIAQAEEKGDLGEVNRLEAHLWLDGPLSPEGRVAGRARALFLEMNGAALELPEPVPDVRREPAWDRLDLLEVPVHIVVGDLDVPHVIDRARVLAQRVDGASMEVMAGVAHMPVLEQPTHIAQSVAQFKP